MSQMPRSEFFTVGPVLLSYTDGLFQKQSVQGSEPKYGCNIIIQDEAVYQQINAQVEQIGRQAFPQEWDIPNKCRHPLRQIAEKPQYAGRGLYFAGVSTQFEPKVVDQNQQPIINVVDPATGVKPIYGGVYAYVSINVYSYRHPQGGPGVSIGIQAAMKVGDGEPLIEGGQVDTQSAFASVPAGPPPGALPPGQVPQMPAAQPGAPSNFGVPGQDPLAYQQQPQAPVAPQAPQTPQYPQGVPQQPQAPQYPQGVPQQPQTPQYPQGVPQQPQAPVAPQAPQAPQYPGGFDPVTGQPIPPVGQ